MIDWCFDKKYKEPVIGVDEVGRGSWSGPVVAAALWIDPNKLNLISSKLDDSKKITLKTRNEVYKTLMSSTIFKIAHSKSSIIDKIGILKATWLAMEKAINFLCVEAPFEVKTILIDGNLKPKFTSLNSLNIETIKYGDAISPSIAAASVAAKIYRDKEMLKLDIKNPGYSWNKNKGYGTIAHRKALLKLGPTQHHRMTFNPMKKLT